MVVWGSAARESFDVGIVADGDDLGAQAAVIQLVEDRAANELTGAVGVDAVEQAGQPRRPGSRRRRHRFFCSFAMASSCWFRSRLRETGRLDLKIMTPLRECAGLRERRGHGRWRQGSPSRARGR